MKIQATFLIALLVLKATSLYAQENLSPLRISTNVVAGDDLRCRAYLWVPADAQDLPLIVYLYGTGIFTSAKYIHPAAEPFLLNKKAAVLTLDKPGIEEGPGDEPMIFNKEIFGKYRQKHLVECTKNALGWALSHGEIGPRKKIVLLGHSEGAQILVRMLNELHLENSPMIERVRALQLSGTPLESWHIRWERFLEQLSEERRAAFKKARKKGDKAFFLSEENSHVSLGYLDDVEIDEAPGEVLHALSLAALPEELAQIVGPESLTEEAIAVEFHHGVEDKCCQVECVRAFEKWYNEQELPEKRMIRTSYHYYPSSGHVVLAKTKYSERLKRDVCYFNQEGLDKMIASIETWLFPKPPETKNQTP